MKLEKVEALTASPPKETNTFNLGFCLRKATKSDSTSGSKKKE